MGRLAEVFQIAPNISLGRMHPKGIKLLRARIDIPNLYQPDSESLRTRRNRPRRIPYQGNVNPKTL